MNTSIYTANPTTAQATGNRVLRNTYLLLSMTLAFAAATAGVSMALNLPHPGLILTLLGYFGLLFLTSRYRDQALGLVFVFALTGFMGYTLGPILSAYVGMSGGPQVVTTALAATALVFVGLSGYAMTTRHDLSFMGGMLFVGILVAFLAGIAAVVFSIPALSLAVSAMFVLLMSGLILYETQQIVRGGETNYIMATVTLFVAIFNLFTSLLHLLGFASQE
ncbi:MAG: Bax inhibitor-1/YccA family protein [Sedimenticolaceae bacterium]